MVGFGQRTMIYLVSLFVGVLLLLIVLWDSFETVVLPRTVTRSVRFTRIFYLTLWGLASGLLRRMPRDGSQGNWLQNCFGPLSLILLFGCWAVMLVVAFGLILYGVTGGHIGSGGLEGAFYNSGSTFVTVGLGVETPHTRLMRFLVVAEAGNGLAFLALVIGYIPVIYQSFSRREVGVSLLGARAGSPPVGAELLRRYSEAGQIEALADVLQEWERWAADILESHLSYPVLTFYRSQHDRESWLAALTAVLDACALLHLGCVEEAAWRARLEWQAQLTFAMARHAVVDLALILHVDPEHPEKAVLTRLAAEEFDALHALLQKSGFPLQGNAAARGRLDEARRQYEPYLSALSERLMLDLPPWLLTHPQADNWQTGLVSPGDHFGQ